MSMFRSLIAEFSSKNASEEGDKSSTLKRKAEPAPKKSSKEAKKKSEEVAKETVEPSETDAPPDTRPILKHKVNFEVADTTVNVIPFLGGSLLKSLSEGGVHQLLAGARANVGIKAGRYAFEVKLFEVLNAEDVGARAKPLLRVGFSLGGSDLISPQENDQGLFFDSDAGLSLGSAPRKMSGARWTGSDVISVVLDMDDSKVTLYNNGYAVGAPHALPEALQGKVLFPHVVYRGLTVQCNFGPEPFQPFQHFPLGESKLLQGAAEEDTEVRAKLPQSGGKYEVVFPVALPDEGTFRWVDQFLEECPHFVELSDRKLADWALKSGLSRKGSGVGSNDKPSLNFGLYDGSFDELSLQRVVRAAAALVPRNYIVMEVVENLLPNSRKENVSHFRQPHFKKVARVLIGEPSEKYKQLVYSKLLQEKTLKAMAEWKKTQVAKHQLKRAAALKANQEKLKAQREKRLADIKAMQEKKQQAAKEAKEKKAAAKARKAAGEDEEPEATEKKEGADEEKPEGTTDKPDAEKEAAAEKEEEVESEEEGPPEVELTDEEKKSLPWHLPITSHDVLDTVVKRSFQNFSMPESDEGFDDVQYEWGSAVKCKDHFDAFRAKHKKEIFLEDVLSSEVFRTEYPKWAVKFTEWQTMLRSFKAKGVKLDRNTVLDSESPLSVKSVTDVGDGQPLFVAFEKEDWSMMNLRYEFFLLVKVYSMEVGCEGLPENNILMFYMKFFGKPLVTKNYGMNTVKDLVALMPDTVALQDSVLVTPLKDDVKVDSFDMFMRLTEEGRRTRERLLDVGDEDARLHFLPAACAPPNPARVSAASAKFKR